MSSRPNFQVTTGPTDMPPDKAQPARIAAGTVITIMLAAAIAPGFAMLSGISVDIAPFSALAWLALTLILAGTLRYYWMRGEQRLALAVGGVLAIEISGAAGGVISIT